MDDKSAPLYSFTYRPSYDDIRRAGRRLLSRPIWNSRAWYGVFLGVVPLEAVLHLLATKYDGPGSEFLSAL